MVRFIIALVLLLASIALAIIMEGGALLAYAAITAFLLEALVPFFATLAAWRLSEIGAAWRDAFSRPVDAASAARSMRVWAFAERICYATGVLGFLAGGVLILGRAGQPGPELARALGVNLLAPLYSVLFGVFCRIQTARVQQ